MFKSIGKLVIVLGVFSIISTVGVSQHREIPHQNNQLDRQMLPPDRHISNTAVIKYETTFANESALAEWTIINQDGSANGSGATVGKFVTGLVFPGGGSVAPKVAGTYFWASNFDNANGTLMDEWLISPQLPVVLPGDTLSFYGGAPEVLFKDSIEVRLATSDPQGGTAAFTQVGAIQNGRSARQLDGISRPAGFEHFYWIEHLDSVAILAHERRRIW
ncbi:MAG: choice-of-anchor J domain-containing protein [Calditrichia bacterium]